MKSSSSVEDLKKSVNIRALISAYENISSEPGKLTKRHRANSVGNALNNNVVVKENPIRTLDDAYRVLDVVERRLQQYEIYNKEKHVAIQEELFNTLTSIINIDNDDPEEAKALIERTKYYVSFLNTKLPSNKNESSAYASRLATFESKANSSKLVQDDEIDSAKSGLTVRHLRERFQVHETKINKHNTFISSFLPTKKAPLPNKTNMEDKSMQNDTINLQSDMFKQPDNDEKTYSVSVQKLKSIFETKSKENAEGLPLILNGQVQPVERNAYKLNLMDAPSDEVELPEVTSYLKTTPVEEDYSMNLSEEGNRLLGILKKVRSSEFNYVLNINDDGKEDANENSDGDYMKKLEYLDENGNEDEGERFVEEDEERYVEDEDVEENYDEESFSSSAFRKNSLQSVDSLERTMMQEELTDQ